MLASLSSLVLLLPALVASASAPLGGASHRRHHAKVAARQAISVSGTVQPLTGPPASSSPKSVVAHMMVGNTYPYTQQDWLNDVQLASSKGIDGFALNVGSDSWQPAQVASAYAAAAASGTNFKLFLSLDMTVLPCASPSDAQNMLNNFVRPYLSHPNQFVYQGKPFVSTFSGESCTFGSDSVQDGWNSQVTSQASMFFAPSFFGDQGAVAANTAVDGYLNWNSAWPVLPSYPAILDATALSALGGKSYIPAISPHFYTHYSPQTYNKNWVWGSDAHWYPNRWAQLVDSRADYDIIEILTWNDYGESSYIGPIEGAQPNSQAWVDGMDHTPSLDIASYYISAFKNGGYPAITTDAVYIWTRPHLSGAQATADDVAQPTYASTVPDVIACQVFATAPGSLVLSAGSASQTFPVVEGVNQFTIPMVSGSGMSATLSRNGATVVTADGGSFVVEGSPSTFNFNLLMVGAQAS